MTLSPVDSVLHRMVRSIMGRRRRRSGGGSLGTRPHAKSGSGSPASWVAPKGATKLEEWLQKDEHTFIKRKVGWQSVAQYSCGAALLQHTGQSRHRRGECMGGRGRPHWWRRGVRIGWACPAPSHRSLGRLGRRSTKCRSASLNGDRDLMRSPPTVRALAFGQHPFSCLTQVYLFAPVLVVTCDGHRL